MKFLSFVNNGKHTFGAATDAGLVDLGALHPEFRDLRHAIQADRLADLATEAMNADASIDIENVELLPTIPNPEKIICIGVNYAKRNAEYKDGSEAPKYPSVAGRRIAEDKAHEHIAGLTIMNEGSVRDYLRHAKFNVTQGKNFEHSGSLGPWLVTPDELDPMSELRVMTYLSSFYRLQPGDIIATGTPNGAGARFDPPKYLRPGDIVEVEVPGIGVLRNSIVTESV